MELMGEEEPSKWRLLFLLLLSPGPVAEAALPARSHASTYAAFPPPSPDPRQAARLSSAPQRVLCCPPLGSLAHAPPASPPRCH